MGYQEALERYIEATNTHDFNNVRKWLDKQAVYWFSDRTCTTMEEIQAYFENSWETVKDEIYRATEVRWVAADENCAACTYIFTWEGYYKGEFASGRGRATNVFARTPGSGWKLVHEHLSV